MTKQEFQEARHDLGLTQAQLAHVMGLSDGRAVRHWENGTRRIPGPVIVLMQYLKVFGPPQMACLEPGHRTRS